MYIKTNSLNYLFGRSSFLFLAIILLTLSSCMIERKQKINPEDTKVIVAHDNLYALTMRGKNDRNLIELTKELMGKQCKGYENALPLSREEATLILKENKINFKTEPGFKVQLFFKCK